MVEKYKGQGGCCVRNVREKKRMGGRQGPDQGPTDYVKEFGFYSKCDGKPVEGFKQGITGF